MFTHLQRVLLLGQGAKGGITKRLQRMTSTGAGHRSKRALVLDYDYASGSVTEHTSDESARDFMLGGETGIYTSMRTVGGGRRVFLLDDHLQRLGDSHRMELPRDAARRDDPAYWRRVLLPLLGRGLAAFGAECPDEEAKITVLADTAAARVHFTCLYGRDGPPSAGCQVRLVTGVTRENPEAKSIRWVHQREALEALLVAPTNEVVLTDGRRFYEGISSNFFATRKRENTRGNAGPEYLDYQLVSAPRDRVLLGTVMKLVLRICDRDGIEVVYDPALDFARWSGAFVTSTSRWVLPVATIVAGGADSIGSVGDGDAMAPSPARQHRVDADDPLVAHLRESVRSMAAENSTKV
ncbi:hypothetical protein H4217_005143 [Coemansia sp. RSA 1939]|nr:hypothetical protein H4217_005143 [Coemansia sp. RSA 1939]KAJ2593036.1 hypothetical protein EV177_008622 [Coemansia sp. RSA 1804]